MFSNWYNEINGGFTIEKMKIKENNIDDIASID